MKTLLRILLALVVLLALGLFLGVRYAGNLVVAAVERGGTQALGVATTLDGASVGIFQGELGLEGLSIANPAGYERPHFLTLRTAALEVSLGSLLGERIEAPLLLLEGVRLDLERRGDRSNYGTLLDHLERSGGQGSQEPPSAEKDGTTKRFVVKQILLRDIEAHVVLSALGEEITKTVTLPELKLENVGNDEQSLRSLVSQVVTAVLEAAVRNLDGVVPAELLADLKGKVANLEQVGVELQAQAQARVDEAVQQVQGQVEETKEQVLDEAKGALEQGKQELEKGLGGLLDGKKKP